MNVGHTRVFLCVAVAQIDLALAIDDVGNVQCLLVGIEVLDGSVKICLIFQKDKSNVIELK